MTNCSGFIQNSPGDIAEMPACTDYCARCGAHRSEHDKTPVWTRLMNQGFADSPAAEKMVPPCGAKRNVAITESYEDWVTCTEPAGHDPKLGHYNKSGIAWFGDRDDLQSLHTMETHEKQYMELFGHPCDDPDCEFHHPEVLED